ncbi:hypothetical protein [Kribbella sp. CA-293567]|uniref:hypothetical protein n=1 Tax=Kribbella sp. CA-293567 TaxID=3002436 RepID=UPI0022DDFCD0|nr:hypothetical protein [Kribbella sp. CA-293567]WBQ04936.1 hypothetical protein OX958_33910 [Kribbella sp. CA-293567]
MTRPGRAMGLASMVSLPVLPLAWFIALQDHAPWMPAAYLGYLLLVIAVPGTLFWRRLTGGTGWFTVDVALGTSFGLAVEALIYPVVRYFDIPLAVLVMPALAMGVYRAFPQSKLPVKPTPWWAMAGVMLAVGVVAAWFVRVGSQLIPIDGPAALRSDTDASRNLALAAELTHHFPPQLPYASGRPLTSHFAVYDHLASAHWITSVELDVLTQRMAPLAFLLLTVLGAAAVGVVLTGRAVAAPIAAGLTVAAGELAAWPWAVDARLFNDSPFSLGQLTNPSQAFSTVLMLPLIAVTPMLLRRKPTQTRAHVIGMLVAATVLIAAISATKASALPVYAAGLAAAWVYLTVQARRLNLRALVLGVGIAACYAFTFFVVLRRSPSGIEFKPGKTFRHLMDVMTPLHTTAAVLVIASIVVIGWLMPAVGALLIKRRLPRDPMVLFLLVGLMASVIAAGLLYDAGQTQVFFVRTGFVYGVLLATWGLGSLDRKQYYVAAAGLLIGAAAIYWGRYRSEESCTTANCFAQPIVVALVIAVIGAGALGLLLRLKRRMWAVVAVAVALGLTVSPTMASLKEFAAPPLTAYESIAPGGIEGARFIRRNSGPNDLIATNIHCRRADADRCFTGSYWIAGYAERRVLVEGWAYNQRVDDSYAGDEKVQGTYWDLERRRLNDQAFTEPTRELLETLRTRYGVQWLLADERVGTPPDALEKLAPLRFHYGTVRIYQVGPPPSATPFPPQNPCPTETPGGSPSPGFPSQTPGGFPTQTPGFPSQTPGGNPSQTPGGFPTQTPGALPSQTPGGLPTQSPGGVPSQNPGASQSPGSSQTPGGFQSKTPGGFSAQPPAGGAPLAPEAPTETPGALPSQTPSPTTSPCTPPTPSGTPSQTPGGFPSQTPGGLPTQTPGGLPSSQTPGGSPSPSFTPQP